MKRPENLYDKNGKLIKTQKNLEFLKNPNTSGDDEFGLEIGIVRGENFLCEDSGLFNIPLSYSVVAKTDVIVYRIQSSQMMQYWPKEFINELKIRVLEKYKWFYERLFAIENHLMKNKTNQILI